MLDYILSIDQKTIKYIIKYQQLTNNFFIKHKQLLQTLKIFYLSENKMTEQYKIKSMKKFLIKKR